VGLGCDGSRTIWAVAQAGGSEVDALLNGGLQVGAISECTGNRKPQGGQASRSCLLPDAQEGPVAELSRGREIWIRYLEGVLTDYIHDRVTVCQASAVILQ
jgi:hypothetical protein